MYIQCFLLFNIITHFCRLATFSSTGCSLQGLARSCSLWQKFPFTNVSPHEQNVLLKVCDHEITDRPLLDTHADHISPSAVTDLMSFSLLVIPANTIHSFPLRSLSLPFIWIYTGNGSSLAGICPNDLDWWSLKRSIRRAEQGLVKQQSCTVSSACWRKKNTNCLPLEGE